MRQIIISRRKMGTSIRKKKSFIQPPTLFTPLLDMSSLQMLVHSIV